MPTFTVTGLGEVSAALRQLAAQVPIEAARALNVVAEETMTEAKIRTPVETGNLRRSGKVHQYAKPYDLSADLSFGTEYAVYVHERVNVRHKTGEAKFLENAIKFTALSFEERIANEINLGPSAGSGTGGGSGSTETFAGPSEPSVFGGPGGSGLL